VQDEKRDSVKYNGQSGQKSLRDSEQFSKVVRDRDGGFLPSGVSNRR
jgi:hypothetical protein